MGVTPGKKQAQGARRHNNGLSLSCRLPNGILKTIRIKGETICCSAPQKA